MSAQRHAFKRAYVVELAVSQGLWRDAYAGAKMLAGRANDVGRAVDTPIKKVKLVRAAHDRTTIGHATCLSATVVGRCIRVMGSNVRMKPA